MNNLLSIVIPCKNEEKSFPLFVQEFARVLDGWQDAPAIEIIAVDDGSTDETLDVFRELDTLDTPFTFKYISFSRNFGKEAALYAGLEAARGDFVVTMDADLQDPPSLLPKMWEILHSEGVDNVATRRVTRKGEPPIRSWCARRFYKLINKMSETEIVDGARDYRMMKRTMVNAILELKEVNRFSKGIYSWVGFKTHWVEYENVERAVGETKWSFWALFKYAIDGVVAFSTKPLSIAAAIGAIFCVISVVALLFIIIRAAVFGDAVAGWPSMMSVTVFFGGLQLLCLGVIGQYLAKTYTETKSRPIYITRERNF